MNSAVGERLAAKFPCTVTLKDGTQTSIRLMTPADADRVAQFARSLPEEDLLFLRIDITNPDVIRNQWLRNQAVGRGVALIAEVNGEMAGYGNLLYNETTWQRHVGEIRIQVGRRYRSQGLGRSLTVEVFEVARRLGVRKIVAQMTSDQKAAIATFEKLGFQAEALLRDFVIDRQGKTRDLVVMAYDVEGLTDHVF